MPFYFKKDIIMPFQVNKKRFVQFMEKLLGMIKKWFAKHCAEQYFMVRTAIKRGHN